MGNFLANGSIVDLSANSPTSNSMINSLLAHLDWLLMAVCLLALVWLVFVVSSSLLKRKCAGPRKKVRTKSKPNTSWRFNPTRSCSNTETLAKPFQAKTICVNYYGGSNGDSEHDMMQSCSQSSHYEEFVQNQHQMIQQQRLLNQQQPIYFNGHSTLGRRTLKQSLSGGLADVASSTCARQQLAGQQLIRLNETLITNGHSSRQAANSSLTSNVPLINSGTINSRINLDQPPPVINRAQYQHQQHYAPREQQPRLDHIYDDVIYNQMIL